MTFKFIRYSLSILVCIALTAMLNGCIDDVITDSPESPESPQKPSGNACEGYELAFAMALDDDEPMAASEEPDYDDYIDTKYQFRIFFFDGNGQFLFNAIDRTVTPLGTDNLGRKNFYVRIPMNYVVDRDGNQFDVEAIKNQLKNNSFKVAILANWPYEIKGEEIIRLPKWGWQESCLNPDINEKKCKTINDLHFPVEDNTVTKTGVYDFITKEGYRPMTVSWVRQEGEKYVGIKPEYDPNNVNSTLIPMYGVQNYDALGDYWVEGNTFDLSDITDSEDGGKIGYPMKDIYLVRCVAKIEVYLPHEADYIKIVNYNPNAKCEPVDVETPTNEIWDKEIVSHGSKINNENNENNENNDKYKGACEWVKLGKYPTWYSVERKDLDSYKFWLARFYGCWQDTNEFAGIGDSKTKFKNTGWWDFESVTLPSQDLYPHIFNPDVSETTVDAEFYLEDETIDGYYKYVIYMPDKFIDNPTAPLEGEWESKVVHVEFKYKEAEYQNGKPYGFYFADQQPESLNASMEELKACYLWPIMRNHLYRIYVAETENPEDPTSLVLRVRVDDWKWHRLTNAW